MNDECWEKIKLKSSLGTLWVHQPIEN
jgi:hypothetical protein